LFDYLDLTLVFTLMLDFVVGFLGLLVFLRRLFWWFFLTTLPFTLGFLELVDLRLIEDDFLVVFLVLIYV
jgi:hypothetical protein